MSESTFCRDCGNGFDDPVQDDLPGLPATYGKGEERRCLLCTQGRKALVEDGDWAKVTGLTRANVQALNEVFADRTVTTTATTATFHLPAAQAVALLRSVMAGMPSRGHPKASLHAVVRKLEAQA